MKKNRKEWKGFNREIVYHLLCQMGYHPVADADGWRMKALYRGGNNPTALKVYEDGYFIDWADGIKGGIDYLIYLTLKDNVQYRKELLKILQNGQTIWDQDELKFISKRNSLMPKIYSSEILDTFHPNFGYWQHRGITPSVLIPLKGGVCLQGKLCNRFVFPIFDMHERIIGFTGRLIKKSQSSPPWKHIGKVKEWVYPLFLSKPYITKEKRVFIVESVGDMLSLMECGINNVLCSFGLNIHFSVINSLFLLDINSIVIAFNNDENRRGNNKAEEMKKKLCRYFKSSMVQIHLPFEFMDFNDMLLKDKGLILRWYRQI